MPKSIPRNHLMWGAAWAVLCVAGLATTAQLNASSAPDPQPEHPFSPQCATLIADIERQMAKTRKEESEKRHVVAYSWVRTNTDDSCDDEIHDHFRGHQ